MQTSLHYADPAAYAEVYEAARTALHQVDPTAQAVVGGMLDSGAIGLDQVEQYLGAIGPMDAVGYHPYLYDVTTMEQDTLALRQWLNANGHAGGPARHQRVRRGRGRDVWGGGLGSRRWLQYTEWALCTPALDVEDVQPVLVGSDPGRRHRPLVLDGRQRALGDSARYRLPRRGPDADVAGMPGTRALAATASATHRSVGAEAQQGPPQAKAQGPQRPKRRPARPHKPARRQTARRAGRSSTIGQAPVSTQRPAARAPDVSPRGRGTGVSPRGRGTYPPS